MAVQTFDIYEGLVYTTPQVPKIKDIKGSNKKKQDQLWFRNEEYENFDWNDDPKQGKVWYVDPIPEQMDWYESEIDRIMNGEWVMINGVPTFFNAFCYFFHQWYVTKEGGYPVYKDTSLIFFRFMEICFNDPRCRGMNVMKGRRIGVSTMSTSIMLQYALIKQNTEQGIASKTGGDAEKIFKLFLVNAFASLPPFLKPRISGNDTPAKILHITKPPERASKDRATSSKREGLNNKIEWRATSGNVFDGDGLWILLLDEAGKWEEVDINAYLPIALKSIVAGSQVGRIIMITTVNRSDKGGDKYKLIWDGSSQLKRDVMGQTDKKLYRLFIPGYMGFEWFVDKFGNSVVDTPTPEQTEWLKKDPRCLNPYIGSKEYCDLQRKNKENDPEEFMEEVRMVPYNPEEVFKSANNLCHFNTIDLNNQIERVEEKIKSLGRNPLKDENGRRGLFKKGDNGKVFWVDNKEGMWYILHLLDEGEDNKYAFKGSIKCPDNTAYGAAGLDTFSNAQQTVDKGSDACCVVFQRYSALNPENSGMPVAMFLGRPKTKEEFHNQVFWGLEYYGIRMLAERSPTDWEDYATSERRRLASPKEEKKKFGYLVTTKRADGSDVYGVSPQDPQGREEHLTEMIEYSLNNMHKINFIRILRDFLNFNIKDRTDYDAAMAFGYALVALKEKTKPKQAKQTGVRYIRTYKLKTA